MTVYFITGAIITISGVFLTQIFSEKELKND